MVAQNAGLGREFPSRNRFAQMGKQNRDSADSIQRVLLIEDFRLPIFNRKSKILMEIP
jgi:hypothetical protein